MPEPRITRQVLRDHFRRLWVLYLAGAVLLVFLNHLVFTVTRPGFSEDETLKIMLLNADVPLDEARLLEAVQEENEGIRALELEQLAADMQDAHSAMLLKVKLTAGFGDIYLADAAGYEMLMMQAACYPLDGVEISGFESMEAIHPESGEHFTGALCRDGLYMVVMENGTNLESALAALVPLAAEIME